MDEYKRDSSGIMVAFRPDDSTGIDCDEIKNIDCPRVLTPGQSLIAAMAWSSLDIFGTGSSAAYLIGEGDAIVPTSNAVTSRPDQTLDPVRLAPYRRNSTRQLIADSGVE
jgi:hypothetical protein